MTIESFNRKIKLAEDSFKKEGLNSELKEKVERVYDLFDSSFIYKEEELILNKKWNIYFRLDNIVDPFDFDYKLLSYCSFYTASNHFSRRTKICKYIWGRLNRWFRKDLTYKELQTIYQKLGCGANRVTGYNFIKSGLDMELLKENTNDR